MTPPAQYGDLEAAGGAPVELYRFVQGAQVWAYTSGDEPVTYNGDTYAPTVIARDAISGDASDTQKAELNIGVAIGTGVVQQLLNGSTPGPIALTIYRYQRGAPSDVKTIFAGQVAAATWSAGEVKITNTPVARVVQDSIPRFMYARTCVHALYDAGCGINPAAFSTVGTVLTVTDGGFIVTIVAAASKADGWFTGGVLQDAAGGQAFIEGHVGQVLTLLDALPGLAAGATATLLAGCDRVRATCATKFNNLARFFGFPYIPTKNPYDGVL